MSLQGSPLRWAAKADEIGMTSSVTTACSPLRDEVATASAEPKSIEQRSCSANQLDVIVDILGVPSELVNQRDNKRLFLRSKDKKDKATTVATVVKRRPRRSTCKVLGSNRNRPPPLESANKSKSCEAEESQDLLMEVKRRSIYAKECR